MELVKLDFGNELSCGDKILCPYCGVDTGMTVQDFEGRDVSTFECECGHEFEGEVEAEPQITTYRYGGRTPFYAYVADGDDPELCKMCGGEIAKVMESGFPEPVFRCSICKANVCAKCDEAHAPCCDEYRFWLEHRKEWES